MLGKIVASLLVVAVAWGPVTAVDAAHAQAPRPSPKGGPPDHVVEALKNRLPDAALQHSVVHGDGRTEARFAMSARGLRQLRRTPGADEHERTLVNRHAEQLMRQGQAVASSALDVVAFEVPDVTPVYLVQHKEDHLSDFEIDVTVQDDSGMMLEFASASASTESSADSTAAGFDAGTGVGSVARRGRGGRTIFWDPAYSHSADHWVTTNWEKWQNTKSGYANNWVYNRYATFDAGNGSSGWRGEIVDATIRSRPWRGYESRVTGGPYSYTPRPQERCPTTATVEVNAGSYGKVSVPIVNCYSGQEIYPNANLHSMGTAFYGRTVAQRYLDFAFEFRAASASTDPIMADYVYMSVQYCWDPWKCVSWNPKQNLRWTDSGW